MIKNPSVMKGLAVTIILLFVVVGFSSVVTAKPLTDDSQKTSSKNDDYDWFSFAIVWGSFEILKYKHISQFRISNEPYYNDTINVIGYVDYEHIFFFKKSYDVTGGGLRIGLTGNHKLFVVVWGDIRAF